MENVSQMVEQISRMAARRGRVMVAIDGRSGAGKTTLAEKLHDRLDSTVFHMDDFFLRPEQRTEERAGEIGGNVDYERFLQEVLLPLKEGAPVTYRPYDCQMQCLKEPTIILPKPISIIEGSYSCHPTLWSYYDLRIFLTIQQQEQALRIRARNGARAEAFFTKWIPMEEAYFSHFQIADRCDMQCSSGAE